MKKLFTRRDLFLILALLLTVAAFFLFRPKNDACILRIEQNGTLLQEIPLSSVTEPKVYAMDTTPPAEITVTREGAYFSSAQCPDQTCVHTGKISRPGELACCLPARLVIRIVANKTSPDLDAITG